MKIRFTDQEISLIKNTFAEQQELAILFRKFLLDGQMSAEEMALINKYADNPAVLAVLRKAINSPLDKMAPPFQSVDLFSNLDMAPTPIDHAILSIKTRTFANKYLKQRFDLLEGKPVENPIVFDSLHKPEGKEKEQAFIEFVARNFLLSHIDVQLFNSLMVIAGTKKETLEEQKKRLQADSNK